MNENKNVAASNAVEKKLDGKKVTPINPEELLVVDPGKDAIVLLQKKFSELTSDDLSKHQKFPAKVYLDEVTTGFGKTREVKKLWYFAMKLAPSVVLKRIITDDELYAIQALNPKLISNKSLVEVPVKCMSGITEEGRRFFRVIACLCHAVYFGSSQNDKRNNGFLSNLQVTNLVINNRLCVTNPELTKVNFYEINKELQDSIEIDYTDELVNSNEDF